MAEKSDNCPYYKIYGGYMGQKGIRKSKGKKKLTKKEKKAKQHLKLIQGKKHKSDYQVELEKNHTKKKAA